jgi:hypothetical protein
MATNKPRVYLDSCCYIDVAKGRHGKLDEGREDHLPFLEALILAAADGAIEIWGSTLLIPECLHIDGTQQNIPDDVQATFISLLTAGSPVRMSAVDYFIAERARDLRWRDGIRCGGGADGIHVATALELKCEEFITSNRKRGPLQGDTPKMLATFGLRVIEPPQTSVLPTAYVPPPLFLRGAADAEA